MAGHEPVRGGSHLRVGLSTARARADVRLRRGGDRGHVGAIAVLYSLKILAVSAAFYVVRIDNLAHLFDAVFDAARWPIAIFRGAVRIVFTFVLPLALMTTYPAQALLGTLPAALSPPRSRAPSRRSPCLRVVWNAALARYTSAGG